MSIKIRKAVFETNSSSSHSLTMGKAELAPQPFPAEVLRSGFIDIAADEYHWEYRRLYTPESKLAYLLTQLTHNRGNDSLDEVRENDPRVEQLCRVVKAHTGCEVRIYSINGGIDHQSVGVGLEVFDTDETLKQFLFSEDSYIQTGNDNGAPPWVINTDRGSEHTYEAFLAEVPKGYVSVKVRAHLSSGFDGRLFTPQGALLSARVNADLLDKVREQGVVTLVEVTDEGSFNSSYDDSHGEWARRLTVDSDLDGVHFKLARDFGATREFKKSEKYSSKGILTFKLPAELKKDLQTRAATPSVLVSLDDAENTLQRQLQYAAKRKAQGQKDDFMAKAVKESKAKVAKLKKQAASEGLL